MPDRFGDVDDPPNPRSRFGSGRWRRSAKSSRNPQPAQPPTERQKMAQKADCEGAMPPLAALPHGQNRDHTRLWDNQWRILWDSATATGPAYPLIAAWVHATIDHPDGTRWVGQFYRCPEGIRRWSYEDLTYLTAWPNPALEVSA